MDDMLVADEFCGFCGSKSRGIIPGSPLIHAESPWETPNHHFQNFECMTVWEIGAEVGVRYLIVPPVAYPLITLPTIPSSLPIILPILPAISSMVLPTICLPIATASSKLCVIK